MQKECEGTGGGQGHSSEHVERDLGLKCQGLLEQRTLHVELCLSYYDILYHIQLAMGQS